MAIRINYDADRVEQRKLRREQNERLQQKHVADLRDRGYEVVDGNVVPVAGGAADIANMQNENVARQLRQMRGQLIANKTDNAITEYSETGDARALSRLLHNDPDAKRIWANRGIMDVANIDLENDRELMERAGIRPEFYADDNDRQLLHKNFYKVFDGQRWDIGDISNLSAQTGYMRRAATNAIDTINNNRAALRASMEGKFPGLEERRVAVQEKVADTSAGRLAEDIEQFEDTTRQKDREQDLKERELGIRERGGFGTSTTKNLAAAEERSNKLLEKFGGEEAFYATDFSKPENKRKALADVAAIEKLEDTQLSEADKKTLTQINELIAVADPVKQLTNKETGIIDNFLGNVKTYMSDNVEGVAAKSSYNTFKNTLRNALFGATLTGPEIKAFNEAFGTLSQQRGPVLEKFLTSINQLQAKMDTLASFSNPLSSHVRMGVSVERLDKIRQNLQTLVDLSQGKAVPEAAADEALGTGQEQQSQQPAGQRPSLADIYARNTGA